MTQTKLSSKDGTVKGNCFRTCLACILDIENPDEIPHFEEFDAGEWFNPFFKFLQDRGLEFYGCLLYSDINSKSIDFDGIDGYYIVGGSSPRGWVTRGHAVVYKAGHLVWDPHPSRSGLIKEEEVYLINKI